MGVCLLTLSEITGGAPLLGLVLFEKGLLTNRRHPDPIPPLLSPSHAPALFHHIFLVPPSQTPNRNRAIIPRQCSIENCARLQRRTQSPPQKHFRRLFDNMK